MPQEVEFFYDYVSPTSYLAWTQLPLICAKYGASLIRRPILLGGVFKGSGNTSPLGVPAKGAWVDADVVRFAAFYDVAFQKNPRFPFNTVPAMRGAIWASRNGFLEAYDKAMFEAAWAHQKNIGNVDELQAILDAAGIDAAAFAQAIQTDSVKTGLIDQTNLAVERGAFGAPTMFVGGVMHFGQDRLPWIERALAAG